VWLSTALAQSTDESRPVLCNTTLVEVYPTGLRLVSTDSFILITGWVPLSGTDHPEPGLTKKPEQSIIVRDLDGRARSLLGYLKGITNGEPEGKAEPVDVVLYTHEPTGPQPSFEGLEASRFVLEVPGEERLALDTMDTAFPGWRQLFRGFTPGPVDESMWGHDGILRLGQLSKFWGKVPIRCTFGGPNQPLLVDLHMPFPFVRALAMPVADKRDAPTTPTDVQQRLDVDEHMAAAIENAEAAGIVVEFNGKRPRSRKKKDTDQ
jgi:hypothetical protein